MMSRLNSTIKLAVLAGNLFFLAVSGIFATFAGLILWGEIIELNLNFTEELSLVVLIISCFAGICSFCGCCGVFYQVSRKGACPGRRILCIYKVALISLLIYSCSQYSLWSKRKDSIELVRANINIYPNYDAFETTISKYFNHAYFDGNCAEKPLDSWIMEWIETSCPPTMSQKACALNEKQKRTCDTTCNAISVTATKHDSIDEFWDRSKCCPSEVQCFDKGMRKSCPYYQCRLETLSAIFSWLDPFTKAVQFVALFSGLMIVLTFLLICYNPRDDIEMELLKTGVMTKDEVKSLRELRTTNKLEFRNGRPSIIWNGNNLVCNTEIKPQEKCLKFSKARKRQNGARISPLVESI